MSFSHKQPFLFFFKKEKRQKEKKCSREREGGAIKQERGREQRGREQRGRERELKRSSHARLRATRFIPLRGMADKGEGFPVAPQGTRGTDLRRCQAGTNPSREKTNTLTL